MVKFKFPGKPSKLAQRRLVPSYSAEAVYESSTAAFDGLNYFECLFANDENDSSMSEFAGFHCFDVSASYQRRERLLNEFQNKFPDRSLSSFLSDNKRFAVSTVEKSSVNLPPPSPVTDTDDHDAADELPFSTELNASFVVSTANQYRKRTKIRPLNQRVFNRYRGGKLQIRHNLKTLSKSSIVRFKHKSSSNYLSDRYCRKFLLPSRSMHSSRIIKPNKRFLDVEKNTKQSSRLCDIKEAEEDDGREIDYEKKSPTIVSSGKVIIREARLNIVTETAIAGPFSAKKNTSEKDKLKYGGGTTCGICGANRHHKHFFHTKKFGIFSCDLCRRFILKMIKQSKQSTFSVIRCKAENDAGRCDISNTAIHKMIVNEETSFKSARCQACWLTMCLQRYTLPNILRKSLSRLLPEKLRLFCTMFTTNASKLMRHHETESSFKVNKSESNKEGNDPLKNRLRTTVSQNQVPCSKSRPITSNENVSSSKKKWLSENYCLENPEKSHHVVRGPRIKHVCRSASAVLKTSPIASKNQEIEDSNSCSSTTTSNQYPHREIEKYSANKGRLGESDQDGEGACQRYGARSLQDFYMDTNPDVNDSEDKMVSIDFWEAYDPDEIFQTGFPLISSEIVNVRALCFLCGSTGLEKLLYCICCCEPYHWYCAEGPSAFRDENELEKCRLSWVCRKCKVCSHCGERSSRTLISCQRCKLSYHSECLSVKQLNKKLFKSDRPWVCPTCLKCKSCNASTVFTYVGNVPLCSECFKLRQKGNYCPLCQGCYQDEDYNVQMMECGICKSWIHAKCEGISYEKYQILSFLPETIEFVCRLCCTTPPAQWWLAVENELTAGYLAILKCLCKNRKIADLLKESPRKIDCECDCGAESNESSSGTVETSRVRRALIVDDSKTGPTNDNVDYASTIDLLKTKSNYRCCCKDDENRDQIGRKLLAVKTNVRNNGYSSLSAFHNELEEVIRRFDEPHTIDAYREILRQYFPWFDPENTKNEIFEKEQTILTGRSTFPNGDKKDARILDEPTAVADGDYETLRRLHAQDEYRYENFRMLDLRTCNFCKGTGEAVYSDGGRLIYCGRNEWVHSNCALWSSEVFEEIDGSLQNVHSAISRGRQIRCTLCEKKGASVGCCYKNCGITYHFACARKVQCKFFQNKTVYCNEHEMADLTLPLLTEEKDFEILRPIYVETDRKKKKLEWHGNVRLRIGSLHVESLGKIDPHLSDHPKRIVPISFRCTRLFWSTIKPWKLVQYRIEIRVRYTYERVKDDEAETNRTTAHGSQPIDESKDDSSNQGNNDLLIPELQGDIYTDLPNDFLNDTTLLHDIWNNYDRAQAATTQSLNGVKLSSNLWRKRIERENEWQRKKKRRKEWITAFLNGFALSKSNDHCLRDKNNSQNASQIGAQLQNSVGDERIKAKRKISYENTSTTTAKHAKFGDQLPSCENILQLDGMVDIFGDEEPVKCIQCHRTYRTSVSFQRHLETCADFDDYMISSEDNDSAGSEDEKCVPDVVDKTVIQPKVFDFTPTTMAPQIIINSVAGQPSVPNAAVVLQNVNPEPMPTTIPATIKLNVDLPVTTPFTLANLCDQSFGIQNVAPATITSNANGTTYVIHSFPKPEVIPTYVTVNGNGDYAISPTETFIPQPMHLQQMTTGFNESAVNFQPMVPTLLGGIVQPNMTLETPTFILNTTPTPAITAAATTTATAELFAPGNIVLPNQPLLFGLETIVSNTVMSSSQFVAAPSTLGALESSTMYSTTTTQYFQAAKPILSSGYSSGYVVLNGDPAPSIQQTQTMPSIATTNVQQTLTVCQPEEKYMYVHVDSVSCDRKSATDSKRPVIIKPAVPKANNAGKPVKVMKVKNNRPIAIEIKTCSAPKNSIIKNRAQPCTPKAAAILSEKSTKTNSTQPCTPKPAVISSEQRTKTNSAQPCTPKLAAVSSEQRTKTNSAQPCTPKSAVILSEQRTKTNSAQPCTPKPAIISSEQNMETNAKATIRKITPKMTPPPSIEIPLLSPISIDMIPPLSPMANESKMVPFEKLPVSAGIEKGENKSNELSGHDLIVQQSAKKCQKENESIALNESNHKSFVQSDPVKLIEPRLSPLKKKTEDSKNHQKSNIDSSPTPESYLKISSIDDEASSKRGTNDLVFEPLRSCHNGRCPSLKANVDPSPSPLNMPLLNDIREQNVTSNIQRCSVEKRITPFLPSIKPSLRRKYQPRLQPRLKEAQITTSKAKSEILKDENDQAATKQSSVVAVSVENNNAPSKSISTSVSVLECNNSSLVLPSTTLFSSETSHSISRSSSVNSNLVDKSSSPCSSVLSKENTHSVSKSPSAIPTPIRNENSFRKSSACVSEIENGPTQKMNDNAPPKPTTLSKASPHENTLSKTMKNSKSSPKPSPSSKPVVNGVLKAKTTQSPKIVPGKMWKTASVSFEVNAEDGFSYKTNDLSDLWSKILESVQSSRLKYNLPLLPKNTLVDPESVYSLLGFDNNASKYLLEQLPDAWKCIFYKPKFHKPTRYDDERTTFVENKSGCARTEPFSRTHKYDMFGWLASRHRKPPKFIIISDSDIVNGNRRVTSLNLPMAMRFRHLKETAKETVGVFRSDIHGRGLFCLRDIDPGEMVIEYAGEVIRSTLTDKREKYYTSKGIGCYMFRIDDRYVVDATMSGNAARFINHSCEPNCYSRIVDILGKKHILIFALRRIPRGEELTYDYKFPLEDEKIYCHCLSRKCRKYLN